MQFEFDNRVADPARVVAAILLVIVAITCSVFPPSRIMSPSFNSEVNLVPRPETLPFVAIDTVPERILSSASTTSAVKSA